MFRDECMTLHRYATALNNIGVAVMERDVFDEASCMLEDAATIARFLMEGDTCDEKQLADLLQSLPSTLHQAGQRLAVISTASQGGITDSSTIKIMSTTLDDWSPHSLLDYIEKGPPKGFCFGIRLENGIHFSSEQTQWNLDMAVIVQNWAVATFAWSRKMERDFDSQALLETSVALFRNSISILRRNGPLTELNQHCIRLLSGWVVGIQNMSGVIEIEESRGRHTKKYPPLYPIRQELHGLVRRLALLDDRLCVFNNDLGPACAA